MDKNNLVANSSYSLLFELLEWRDYYGNKGYDPYDIKGLNKYTISLNRNIKELNYIELIFRILLIELLDKYLPLITRKLFLVKKKIHPTAEGLFLNTYLLLYKHTKDLKYLDEALRIKNWLVNNRIIKYNNICWGTPFKWKSGNVKYGPNVPIGIIGAWVGNAFYDSACILNDERDLDICNSICQFFINDLNVTRVRPGEICFSYSPNSVNYILNSNLYIAEYLIKIGTFTNNPKYINYGTQALNYTISNIKSDNSLPYFGKEQNKNKENDAYHSGFEIRMLHSIGRILNDSKISEIAYNYFKYYVTNYFDNEFEIKLRKTRKYPIDIASCSEGLLVLNTYRHEAISNLIINKHLNWIKHNMKSSNGYYYYRIFKNGYKVKIPYIRWSEAWMAYALVNIYITNSNYCAQNIDTKTI